MQAARTRTSATTTRGCARFYLFTLKAYAYLQMRLGCLDEGRAAVTKLLELDPSDKIGARVLLDVLEAAANADE